MGRSGWDARIATARRPTTPPTSTDPAARPRLDNLNSQCGTCHSGPQHPIYGEWQSSEHAKVAIGCTTCHEAHNLTGFPDQLRATLFSTNDYYTTAAQVFPNNNNPRINLCAQCHNDLGASWTNTSAPPLPTPQYNMLLGTVGELNSGPAPYDPVLPRALHHEPVRRLPYANLPHVSRRSRQ